MKWAWTGACVALVATLTCGACGSFGAEKGDDSGDGGALDGGGDGALDGGGDGALDGGGDATAACVLDPCTDAGPSCSIHDFSSGCGSSFSFSGNTGMAGVVGDCTSGKAHVAADGTLDIRAELAVKTPGQYDAVRVSARIAVKDWDGGPALTVQLDRTVIAVIRAVKAASGRPRFSLCDAAGTCANQTFDANVDEEHTFVLDITRTQVALSVDCVSIASYPASINLALRADLLVDFGHTDAAPVDGTLDDLSVSYR